MDESRLRSVPLFAGLSRKELKVLATMTDEVTLAAGTHLIDEGAFSYEFLLIISGNAEVRRHAQLVATLGPGDFVGEVGAMRDDRRNASVIATSDMTAIVMTARDLRRVAEKIPSVGAHIDAAVAARSQSASASSMRQRREAIVREHMDSENRHDFDTTIGTFSHPHYELIATGETHDGEAEVRRYYEDSRTAFPDQRNEVVSLHHADDAVIVEFDLLGTHLGPLGSMPPTGRAFRCRMTAFFVFEDDRICAERVYFDQSTILRQLGLAHNPNSTAGRVALLISHPVTIGRALMRR